MNITKETEDHLQEIIKACSVKGWDSYGGEPITLEIIEKARWAIRNTLPINGFPFVSPCGDGDLLLDWRFEGCEVEIYISLNELNSIVTDRDGIVEASEEAYGDDDLKDILGTSLKDLKLV